MASFPPGFRCILHGSFRKNFDEIRRVRDIFESAGIEVLAPTASEIDSVEHGFVFFPGERGKDPRLIELLYLHNLKRLGENGFSYFVNPVGEIGVSASYELGIAQISNVPCFFMAIPLDHPAYAHKNSAWSPELFAEYIKEKHKLPPPKIRANERTIHRLWENLMVAGSIVAVGGIIEYAGDRLRPRAERDVLLVKTHKWGGRYSVVGGKVRQRERLEDALRREINEETGFEKVEIGEHLVTFDQFKNSGYYQGGIQHIFVDKIIRVGNRNVRLNEEAQEFLWIPARAALRDLDIEPNARHILELYAGKNNK